MKRIREVGAEEAAGLIRSGSLSAEEYVAGFLEEIVRRNREINAFITVLEEDALHEARAIDRRVSRGEKLGLLCGIPVALKDVICTQGVRTTCGSRMLKDFVPGYSAHVVERIREEGGVILGKTNMDEFAMGSSTEQSYFGPTRNPNDTERVAGGSSGGSGAAVAGGMAPLALGSDTGGSVRCPASFCGVVGLKATYGLVSRFGLISFANSLEQIGPMAGDVRSAILLFRAVSGPDPRDSTTLNLKVGDYEDALREGIRGLRIGISKELIGEGLDSRVAGRVWEAAHALEEVGADLVDVSLPNLDLALPAYYIICTSEASSNLARYDGMRYGLRAPEKGGNWEAVFSRNRRLGFGEEVRRRIILGTYALSAGYYNQYYLRALRVRRLIRTEFERSFKKCDVIITPTMPTPAFRIGERSEDPIQMYLADMFTVPANLTGMPAISIPCGSLDGLPLGLQILGPPLREDLVFRVAYGHEQTAGLRRGGTAE